MAFVYKITSPSGRIYIGSTNAKKIKTRWSCYKRMVCYNQTRLFYSLKKYGYDNHKLEVIWEGDISEMYKMESFYGIQFNVLDQKVGLNCCLPKVEDSVYTISEETRKKMSNASSNRPPMLASSRAKLRAFRLGSTMPQHIRDNVSKGRKGISSHKEISVICTKTGIIFSSIKFASIYVNKHKAYLAEMLRGEHPNKTTIIYYKKQLLLN